MTLTSQDLNSTTIIKVLDAERGVIAEETLKPQSINLSESAPYPRTARGRMTVNPEMLMEATTGGSLSTPNFPDLLRQGVTFDAFATYAGTPVVWPQLVSETPSSKQQEEYLKDAAMGIPPIVAEGQDYPKAITNLNDGVTVKNYKRGFYVEVTEEMRRFDQLGKVRQISEEIGRSLRTGEEYDVFAVLTTAANYTRNSTTKDNDIGANQADTDFGALGLIAAYTTLTTMKDRKSGMYLGVQPNTLIVAPRLKFAAMQLIRSAQSMRAATSATEAYGTGTDNPFFGMVDTIIVSPWLGSTYEWLLMERGRALKFQRVDPMQVLPAEHYKENDVWKYFCRNWYGVGMVDDRFAFWSPNTTAPVIS